MRLLTLEIHSTLGKVQWPSLFLCLMPPHWYVLQNGVKNKLKCRYPYISMDISMVKFDYLNIKMLMRLLTLETHCTLGKVQWPSLFLCLMPPNWYVLQNGVKNNLKSRYQSSSMDISMVKFDYLNVKVLMRLRIVVIGFITCGYETDDYRPQRPANVTISMHS